MARKNREEDRKYRREYYRSHREEKQKCYREYYRSHKEQENRRTHEYRLTHKEQQKETSHRYYAKNKDKISARKREYLSAHREKYNEYQRMYKITHPHKFLKSNRNRNIRHTKEWRNVVLGILREHSFKCDRCDFNDARALEIHHMFGSNYRRGNARMLELKERKVPIAVLCANCHKILHNPRKMTANGEQIIADLQARALGPTTDQGSRPSVSEQIR